MKHFGQTVENTMAAVAFAEAGELREAMKIAGIRQGKGLHVLSQRLESDLIRITFAEAGCFQWTATQ